MSSYNSSENLSATKNNSNNTYSGDQGWFIRSRYLSDYGLSFVEAGFYTMLVNLSSKKGYCTATTKYFEEQLGVESRWIERKLNILQDKKLVFVNRYHTKFGIKRQVVTPNSTALYLSFLHKTKQFSLLKKFQEEFIYNNPNHPDPDPSDTPITSESSKPSDKISSPPKPSDKMPVTPSDKVSVANNTTYYPNKISSVTCKGSDDPGAAPFENLRKELEREMTSENAALGIRWYFLQTDKKRDEMKKPIACIINAIKKGYAREQVDEEKAKTQEIQKEKKKVVEKIVEKKKELSLNEKYAKKVLEECGFQEGFQYKMDRACFVITNTSLEKQRDEETNAPYFIFPSGHKHYGARAAVRVEFKDSYTEFKSKINSFVRENGWTSTPKRMEV